MLGELSPGPRAENGPPPPPPWGAPPSPASLHARLDAAPPPCPPGHAYYFLEDVYPRLSRGRRPLATPAALTALFARAGGGGGARVDAGGRRVRVD
jgi:hypothetical protein